MKLHKGTADAWHQYSTDAKQNYPCLRKLVILMTSNPHDSKSSYLLERLIEIITKKEKLLPLSQSIDTCEWGCKWYGSIR